MKVWVELTPGGCLLRLMVYGGIVAILAAIAVPPSHGPASQVRAKAARARSDIRLMGTHLDLYHEEHGAYPSSISLQEWDATHNNADIAGHPAGAQKRTEGTSFTTAQEEGLYEGFRGWGISPGGKLTTAPLDSAYTLKPQSAVAWGPAPRDPFTQLPFRYFSTPAGWILISAGPDEVYDIDPLCDWEPSTSAPQARLEAKTYDPTNGTTSPGDIWRARSAGVL